MQHLCALGHERFALVALNVAPLPEGTLWHCDARRFESFERTVRKTCGSRSVLERFIIRRGADRASRFDAMLDSSARFTAWFFPDANLGAAFLEHCQDRGLDIPGDLSLVTFHVSRSTVEARGLTGLNTEGARLGRIAAEQIHRAICRGTAPLSTRISVALVERGSTAGPGR